MASITYGDTTREFHSLRPVTKGNFWPVPTVAADIWHVPGIDGSGIGLGSWNDPEIEVECVEFGTRSQIIEWMHALESLLGATVQMTSNLSQIRRWVAVLEITESRVDAALIPGTTVTTRGFVRMRVVVKFQYTRQPGRLSFYTG